MSKRADYLRELEGHWAAFKDAGFVEQVRYYAYASATDAVGETGTRVDAIRHGDGERKVEEPTPDGGFAIVRRVEWHLRRSQLDGPVTKRGKIVDADSVSWVVDDVSDAGDETDWVCQTVRL